MFNFLPPLVDVFKVLVSKKKKKKVQILQARMIHEETMTQPRLEDLRA